MYKKLYNPNNVKILNLTHMLAFSDLLFLVRSMIQKTASGQNVMYLNNKCDNGKCPNMCVRLKAQNFRLNILYIYYESSIKSFGIM
jgi:hypothetical protein